MTEVVVITLFALPAIVVAKLQDALPAAATATGDNTFYWAQNIALQSDLNLQ